MKSFRSRRLVNTLALLAALAVLLVAAGAIEHALRPGAVFSGFLLLAILLILTLFNARKKLPFLPLLKASSWLQLHIYAGLFSVALFLVHTGFRFPDGIFEVILAVVFIIVSLSGIIGLLLTRSLPRKITSSGESIIYERIPALRHQTKSAAEDLVVKAERELQSSSLTDFYTAHIGPYMRWKPGVSLALGAMGRSRQRRLEDRIVHLRRYLADQELPVLEELRDLVDTKRNLDYQYSAQRLLKIWLFVHIPFTYSLLLFAIAHGLLALNFVGRIH
jgi:hypothetical protein